MAVRIWAYSRLSIFQDFQCQLLRVVPVEHGSGDEAVVLVLETNVQGIDVIFVNRFEGQVF